MAETYRESGRFGELTIPGIVGCAVVGAGLAWVYQRLVDWVPLIYVNFLLTLGFGIALGVLVAWVLKRVKNRNRTIMIVTVLATVLAADAASFYWAYRNFLPKAYEELEAEARREGGELVPYEEFKEKVTFDMWREARVESGWSVGHIGSSGAGKSALSGVFVYAIWLLELGILLYLTFKASSGAHGSPFCETCDRWMDGEPLGPWRDVDSAALRKAARVGDDATLLQPKPAERPSGEHANYVLHTCAGCKNGGVVEAAVSHVERDSKGKISVVRDVLLTFSATSAQRDALRAYEYPEPAELRAEEPEGPLSAG